MIDNQWRKPYSNEKNILLDYFTKQHNVIEKGFFTIWILLGYVAIIGWIITYLTNYIKNGFDLVTTIMLPFCCIVVYLFFIKLGHKIRDEWSCRELNAVKTDTAVICRSSVINKYAAYASRNNGNNKYHYYVKVNLDWQNIRQVVDIRVSHYHYNDIYPGDTVLIFNISYDNPHILYLSAYSENILNLAEE